MATRVRKTGRLRRLEIAEAALEILGSNGPQDLSTRALADRVGLSTGALFRHFSSKEEIIEYAVEVAVERVSASFPDAALPADLRWIEMIRERVQLLRREPGIAWLLLSDQAQSLLSPSANKRLADLVRASGQFLRRALEEAAKAGHIRGDIPIEDTVMIVMGSVLAAVGLRGAHGSLRIQEHSARERWIESLLRLLAPPSRISETSQPTDKRSSSP
ncbi:MAG TPA: TetR/AcrR family transcriptional regulator [Planctomycetes bacterium]|nr:TetR/AcrR family transcriptional regulator [Planctomycetota bacterium]